MTQENFAFTLVKTFEEVIPALSSERFDVVIPTNMWLSADDIPDLVSRIRREYSQVGILIISGWTEIKDEVLLRDARFRVAPVPLEEFSCRVKNIIARKRLGTSISNVSLQ